jgi:hypothetical protein
MNNENSQPLSTQGDNLEKGAQLGGTTNLSLDQLKNERGIANPAEDDLKDVRVGDDLN